MFELVKKVHTARGDIPAADIPEPNWDECNYHYWPSGSHKWKKGVDVECIVDQITDGESDGSNVFIASDAFSNMQGWVEGALRSVSKAYDKAFPSVLLRR